MLIPLVLNDRLNKFTSKVSNSVRRARAKFQKCANGGTNPPVGAKAGPKPGDYIIAYALPEFPISYPSFLGYLSVMGPTGAGKSTVRI